MALLNQKLIFPGWARGKRRRRPEHLALASSIGVSSFTSNGGVALSRPPTPASASGSGTLDVLKRQLGKLRWELANTVEKGEQGVAITLISANYELLKEQIGCGIQGIEQAALLDVLAQGHLDMGDFERATALLQELRNIMELQQERWNEPLAHRIFHHMGAMYVATGKPGEAAQVYERCIEVEEKLYGKKSAQLVDALLGCASAYARAGKAGTSSMLYRRIIDIVNQSNAPDSELLLLSLFRLGLVLMDDGKHLEADVALSKAARIMNQLPGGLTTNKQFGCSVVAALAQAKHLTRENEESAKLYNEALGKYSTSFDADDPYVVNLRIEYADVLNLLGRFEEALKMMEDNLAAVQARTGPSGVELIEHLKNVAVAHANCGNLEKCETAMRRRLQVVTSHYGPKSWHLCPSLEMLATLLLHQGRSIEEAEALARHSLLLCEKEYGKVHPLTAPACNCLAGILFAKGSYAESQSLMTRVLEVQETQLGGMNLNGIAQTLERLITINDELGADKEPLTHRLSEIKQLVALEEEQLTDKNNASLLKKLGTRYHSQMN